MMALSENAKTARSLLGVILCIAPLQARTQRTTLPEAVINARTVYIENETGIPELEYTAILELQKWGRFELAESRAKADLTMRLDKGNRVRALPEGQHPSAQDTKGAGDSSVPKGYTRISLLNPKTGTTLWSDLQKTENSKVRNGHLLDGLRKAFDDYEKDRYR
jgi:hypothetical protein